MDAKIFSETPNELKTIEVDVEKKIFNVNGVPFGGSCTSFSISSEAGEGFRIYMELNTTVKFASYEMGGKKIEDYTYKKHSP